MLDILKLVRELKSLDNERVNEILFNTEIIYPCEGCIEKWIYCDCDKPKKYNALKSLMQ